MNEVIHTKALAATASMFSLEEAFKNETGVSLTAFVTKNQFNKFQHERLNLRKAEQQASIMMHHDAITGTNTEQTFNDYVSRVRSVKELLKSVRESIFKVITET